MDLAVTELLASRICHDMISPVGAVHNGVEFLEEMGADAGDEALSLIAHSSTQAAAKLQVFRIVYGAGGKDPHVKIADIHTAFNNIIEADGKIKQDWHALDLNTDDLPAGVCKMLLGVLMMAQESLPKGGSIRVKNENSRTLIISAEGENANIRAEVEQALTGEVETADLTPRTVHAYVMKAMAADYGFAIAIAEISENRVNYSLKTL